MDLTSVALGIALSNLGSSESSPSVDSTPSFDGGGGSFGGGGSSGDY